MVICLERDADLHMALLMPLLLTVSCFSKIQIGFTFLVPAHPGSPGKRAVKRVCVCVVVFVQADAACRLSGVDTVQYLDLDHGASAAACADGDHEPARPMFPAADTTDYKEIDPLKTKALQATRCEVESERRRSSDKLMEV